MTSFYLTSLIIDTGTGARKKIVQEERLYVNIEEDNRNALIGFLVFTGCDYISLFFCQGTHTCCNKINSKSCFKEVMARLWVKGSVDKNRSKTLGEFKCAIYGGGHVRDVEILWFNSFFKKQEKNYKKRIDFSVLPSSKTTRSLHILHANKMVYLMQRSAIAHVNEPALLDRGWNRKGNVILIEKVYPSSLEILLV